MQDWVAAAQIAWKAFDNVKDEWAQVRVEAQAALFWVEGILVLFRAVQISLDQGILGQDIADRSLPHQNLFVYSVVRLNANLELKIKYD